MARPSMYPRELSERAVRMVLESKDDYPSEFEAIRTIAGKLGIGSPETLRKWVRRAEVVLGVPAKLLRLTHHLFPNITLRLLGATARALPR